MTTRYSPTGATPLSALDAVALDLETTGLDTKAARIVQIAGVGWNAGDVAPNGFTSLVRPGMAIPPASTAIHGISDADVADAPHVAAAVSAFEAFRKGRLVIGYAIGFDFAVLAAEAARNGFHWQKPRALCVRLLGSLANPILPDQSLETLAGWLDVPLHDRHSALGDARAAADILTALLPHLAARGIRTLAEAERACLALQPQLESQHRAGWLEPVSRPEANPALAKVDPYAYRHRISEIMSTPVTVARSDMTAGDAIRLMTARRLSALFVSPSGAAGNLVTDYGIVTERDMMRLIADEGASGLAQPLGTIATHPLVSIAGEAFLYRAVGRMDRLAIRHLAVRDGEDRLVGMVSARDLLRLRAGAAISLDDELEAATSPAHLAAAWAKLAAIAARLIAEEIPAATISAIISEELRVATRKAVMLAQSAMRQDGLGEPPCPYAVIVLGSGGRGESLLASDQDNAIVFAAGEPDGPEDRWFGELGRRFAAILDQAGIVFCKGGVMAKNAEWRGSVETWHQRIAEWVARSSPADLLNVDIFFDERAIHGEQSLADHLFARAYELGSGTRHFPILLGERMGGTGSPFTFLGGLNLTDGRIDLKRHGLFPVVAFARAVSIRHDLRHRGTRRRLEALIAAGIGNADELRAILDAHALILRLMLDQQAHDLAEGVPVSSKVATARLSNRDVQRLKAALKTIETLPALLRALVTR